MYNKFVYKSCIILFVLALCSCDKDDPEIPDEPELITTLNYSLVPSSGGATVVLSFKDIDGDGGMAAEISGGTLSVNETYTCTLELLNEAESPAEDITAEISEEDEDHQFFFSSTISDLLFEYSDQDSDGNPIGLSSTLTTAGAATGSITIILKHEPKKNESGVSDGDITNAGGETDIQVTLPIDVQ